MGRPRRRRATSLRWARRPYTSSTNSVGVDAVTAMALRIWPYPYTGPGRQGRLEPMSDTMARRVERLSGDESCPKLRGWPLLIGFALAVPAGAALLVRAAGHAHAVPTAIYVAGLVALYGVGWIYHLLRWKPGVRARLRRLDHAVIYFFIAATYTPIAAVGLHDAVGW